MAQTKTAKKPAAKKATTAKKASPKKKAAPKKAAPKRASKKAAPKRKRAKAGEEEVTLDRRRENERREEVEAPVEAAAEPKLERREKVNRRRQIDPTTCERDYSDSEVEFMNALDAYKRSSGRMFPTCSEVLEVIRGMGYVQLTPAEQAMIREERGEVAEDQSVENVAEAEAEAAFAASDELRVD